MEMLPVTLMEYGLGIERNTADFTDSSQELNLALTDVKRFIPCTFIKLNTF